MSADVITYNFKILKFKNAKVRKAKKPKNFIKVF